MASIVCVGELSYRKRLGVFLLLYSILARQQPGHFHWTFLDLVTPRFEYLAKSLLLLTLQAVLRIITNPANTKAHLNLWLVTPRFDYLAKRSVPVDYASCCKLYYKSCKYKGPFEFAMDASAVTAVLRMDLRHSIHWDDQANFICFSEQVLKPNVNNE